MLRIQSARAQIGRTEEFWVYHQDKLTAYPAVDLNSAANPTIKPNLTGKTNKSV